MDYASIYPATFFDNADGRREWGERKLKYGDALAAIAYAFGLPSFEALRAVVAFEGVGRDPVHDGLTAVDQLSRVRAAATRIPTGALEIGIGRGEVTASLVHLGCPVQAIEPSPGAVEWLSRTAKNFFDKSIFDDCFAESSILNGPAHEVLPLVEWRMIDTVLMVESLEHILEGDFVPVYDAIRDRLRACGGRFIVTNWIDYHPIQVGWYASKAIHCRGVDDALYDAWSVDAKRVVYRNGSHLVLDY